MWQKKTPIIHSFIVLKSLFYNKTCWYSWSPYLPPGKNLSKVDAPNIPMALYNLANSTHQNSKAVPQTQAMVIPKSESRRYKYSRTYSTALEESSTYSHICLKWLEKVDT